MADTPIQTDSPAGDGAFAETNPSPPARTAPSVLDAPLSDALGAAPEKKKKKDKKEKPEIDPNDPDSLFVALGQTRGVETLFRTSYRVNMDLTALADAKANIMISINGLIVSILIASIAPKADANPWLLVPTSVFLIGCLISLIFAVLSARPRVQSHVISLEESRRHHTNLLFFGNFAHLTESDFKLAIKERMLDPVDLYGMMLSDIYGVGSVLQRKYMLLRASYGAFLIALVLGVVGFIGVIGYASYFESGPTIVAPIGGDAATGAPVIVNPALPMFAPAE